MLGPENLLSRKNYPVMNAPLPILVFDFELHSAGVLTQFLAAHTEYQGVQLICKAQDIGKMTPGENWIVLGAREQHKKFANISAGSVLPRPVRLGALLSRIDTLRRRQEAPPAKIYRLQGGVLDVARSVFIRTAPPEEIRLTDKERDILRILHDENGRTLPREDLLHRVWGYADNVETHTLETHIYRLRQKIEIDPAAPQILMTDEKGYFLKL